MTQLFTTKFLLIFIIVLINIHHIDCAAKKCHQCITVGCDDPFNSKAFGVSPATSTNGWCFKSKRIENGKTTITRLGSFPCASKGCTTTTGTGFKTIACCCDKDFCNNAIRSKSTVFSVLIIFIFALGFIQYFY
ncbi:hypothetical protein I4U23_015453 [Adineta vaga]|nr:hypothetical protein I4U23_015453 [Adineta vaga]